MKTPAPVNKTKRLNASPIQVPEISDGLEVLRNVMSLREIASLIERTARWVSPETFQLLPLWFPEHARKSPFYKENWSTPLTNTNRVSGISSHKFEGNVNANQALTLALGLTKKLRPNWSCCHIWGIDDGKYQLSNHVVMDRRYYSCVANMVLLPTPLKAFTDALPEIKTMLRICARNLYEWECGHEGVANANKELANFNNWDSYPESWPRSPQEKLPLGVVNLTPRIRTAAEKRKSDIKYDLEHAGKYYPREKVREVLKYWNITL